MVGMNQDIRSALSGIVGDITKDPHDRSGWAVLADALVDATGDDAWSAWEEYPPTSTLRASMLRTAITLAATLDTDREALEDVVLTMRCVEPGHTSPAQRYAIASWHLDYVSAPSLRVLWRVLYRLGWTLLPASSWHTCDMCGGAMFRGHRTCINCLSIP